MQKYLLFHILFCYNQKMLWILLCFFVIDQYKVEPKSLKSVAGISIQSSSLISPNKMQCNQLPLGFSEFVNVFISILAELLQRSSAASSLCSTAGHPDIKPCTAAGLPASKLCTASRNQGSALSVS